MRIGDCFPSRYVRAADLNGGDVTLTMAGVAIDNVTGDATDPEERPVVSFREDSAKPLVLNRTNANTIAALYGEDTEAWLGRRITLYATEVAFRGRMVPCIRVRSQAPPAAAQETTGAATAEVSPELLAKVLAAIQGQGK